MPRKRPANPRAELAGVVRELNATVARNRRGIKLIERSALDWRDLAALYFQQTLTTYIERRSAERLFRRGPDPSAAARLIIEVVAYFAMHRNGDPDPMPVDGSAAEETAADMLVNALIRSRA